MTTAKNQNKDAEKKTKTTAKKTTTKKTTAKKTTAKKTVVKKTTAKKTAAKKTVAEKPVKQEAIVKEVKEIKPEPKPEVKPEFKPTPKAEVKQDFIREQKPQIKPEAKPEVKQEPKPEFKPEPKPVQKPVQKEQQKAPVTEDKPKEKVIKILGQPTIKELAEKMDFKINDFIKKLMGMGIFATINQKLEPDMMELVLAECGFKAEITHEFAEEEIAAQEEDNPADLAPRAPVVTIMGHVDHGKTSLLDAIRHSNVVAGEFGAITQHIGAYRVKTSRGYISFLDTPGHEAFTAMRARGAQATDIVILVVSATDGIMPQTIEAINHAQSAKAPIIVAVNKIDLPGANPDRVKQDLASRGLVPEEWQGNTIFVEISAKKRINIDKLLEMVSIQAEMMELKANPKRKAVGVILESKRDNKRGVVATVLVQKGTLKVGDPFIVGTTYGRV
ncbi:MAG: translation initiation factor IF-2, partial [Elusimicrobiaceae bacterium]|nr:translation initiation factor IF-2 [Elusimicrobiaceae bacterium]